MSMQPTWKMPSAGGMSVTVRCGAGPRRDPRAVHVSEATVQAWIADPACRPAVLQMVALVSGGAPPAPPTLEAELRRHLARHLARAFALLHLEAVEDRTRLASGPRRTPSDAEVATARPRSAARAPAPRREESDAGARGPAAPAGAGVSRPRSSPPPKTWIEVVLVDAAGRPVAGERCRLLLPDGSVRVEVLDASGRLRLDGIDPGTCDVSFPDLDGRSWRRARP
jgi:hypothetical protein